jgi:hypothetical protein
MEAIVLTFLMYFTPSQVDHGTPEKITMGFQSYAECEFYLEQHKPEIEQALVDGLLGYSAKCEMGE